MDPVVEPSPSPSTVPGPSHPVGPGKVFKSTPEQRKRWRLKAELARARRLAASGDPAASQEVERIRGELGHSTVGNLGMAPGANPATVDAVGSPVGPIPWDAGVLSPLFATLVPELEKLDVESLKAQAIRIDPDLARKVETDARWNPIAKTTIQSTGPQVIAQSLNSMGISAEHGPAIALATAVASIFASRSLLSRQLEQIAARKRQGESVAPVPDQTGE